MSASNFGKAMQLIAGSEGGYVNHPNDPGGPTNKGVTLAVYKAYCKKHGKPVPGITALKAITEAEVAEIFRDSYWRGIRGDDLPAGLDYACADFAFNSGTGQAVKEMQRVSTALGFDTSGADGKIGDFTLNAVRDAFEEKGEDVFINAYMDKRWAFMQKLKNFSTFKNGWQARIKVVRENALRIAHGEMTFQPSAAGRAKADPNLVAATSISGNKSTLVSVGGAVATGAGTAGAKLLDTAGYASDANYMLYAIGGFVLLTIIGGLVTVFILNRKPVEEGTV